MTPAQLAERWQYARDQSAPQRLPVKLLQYNHCPAIAPGFPKDEATQKRLGLNEEITGKHLALLHQHQASFAANILEAVTIMDKQRDDAMPKSTEVDEQLYDGFIGNDDKQIERAIRAAKPDAINDFGPKLRDERLKKMLPLYKARNYPGSLSSEERADWELFCRDRLMGSVGNGATGSNGVAGGPQARLAKYFERLQELASSNTDSDKSFLLEELQLYGQSVLPAYEDA